MIAQDIENKLVPHDLDAERGLLGCMMFADAAQVAEVRLKLPSHDRFFSIDYGEVFRTFCSLIDANKPLDAALIVNDLKRRNVYEEIGGMELLANVLNTEFSAAGITHYAEIVRETAVRRDLIKLAAGINSRAHDPFGNGDELTQEMLRNLTRLTGAGLQANYLTMGEVIHQVREQMAGGGLPLVPTGFDAFDAVTGGVALGEMLIVAARPSMGKSTLIRQMALNIARSGVAVGIISLEERPLKMGRNLIANVAQVDNHIIRRRMMNAEQHGAFDQASLRLSELPIFITETARKIQDIRAISTVWATRHEVKVIFLDYLQRVRGAIGVGDYERISATSLDLSDLFKDVGAAGIVCAQLSRGPEQREDKRPIMSDLRGSGQIEQDADGIVFLHRDDYYNISDGDKPLTGIAELIIGKWRDGLRSKVVKLRSNLKYQRFENLPTDSSGRYHDPVDEPFPD